MGAARSGPRRQRARRLAVGADRGRQGCVGASRKPDAPRLRCGGATIPPPYPDHGVLLRRVAVTWPHPRRRSLVRFRTPCKSRASRGPRCGLKNRWANLITRARSGVAAVCMGLRTPLSDDFLGSELKRIAPYYVPGGFSVVPIAPPSHPPRVKVFVRCTTSCG